MKFTLILLTCFFHGLNSKEKYLRISGGREAVEGEFPYVVRLFFQESIDDILVPGNDICTCSILTKSWTLTAAHCVDDYAYYSDILEEFRAVIEYQTSQKSETAYSKVLYHVSHHGFSPDTGGSNDIALLKTQPVLVAKYGKLSSLDYTTLYGQQVAIVGYGMINSTSAATVPHIPHVLEAIAKECKASSYPNVLLCYAVPCSKQKNVARALCSGDSGGPTIHASGIVAVSVFSDNRDCDEYVRKKEVRRELYHRGYNMGESLATITYIDWIASVMKKDNNLDYELNP